MGEKKKSSEPTFTEIRRQQMVLAAKSQAEQLVAPLFKDAMNKAVQNRSTSFSVKLDVTAEYDEDTYKWCVQTTGTSNVDVKSKVKSDPEYVDLLPTLFDNMDHVFGDAKKDAEGSKS